jgi:hypothetical protein
MTELARSLPSISSNTPRELISLHLAKDIIQYVSILKWNQGEVSALATISDEYRKFILPIAELPNRPFDWDQQIFTKSWGEYIRDQVEKTIENFGRTLK